MSRLSAAILFATASMLSAQTVSDSKLSVHLINSYTTGTAQIVAGHPRVLKILDTSSGMLQAARAYKAAAPDGKIVLRIYTQVRYTVSQSAATSATNFWTTVLRPPLNALSASDRQLIDYVEGPNEGESTPTWGTVQDARWYSDFWVALSQLIANAGYRPCIGSIAVGNPPGNPSEVEARLAAFVPALRKAKNLGGAWSYHSYTIQYTTDVGVEVWYSLRYRQFYDYFRRAFTDLNDMPLILTEGGVDESGNPNTSGWKARGTASDFKRWLNWFDSEMRKDAYLIGCTLFQIGNPTGWSSFDLEPIAPWMGTYLKAPTNAPPAPTTLSATGGSGRITMNWVHDLPNPTTFKVKRSTTRGGPYTTIAQGITGGVKSHAYVNAPVTGGITYYYVVTAVNAFGESLNSNEASAAAAGGLPDVVVTAINWTPANPTTGSSVTFRATVKNQGTAAVPSTTELGVGFQVDGGSNVAWYVGPGGLAAGASVTVTANGGPSGALWKATAGRHNITAIADDINRFAESNDANNAMTLPFTVFTPSYAVNCGGPAALPFAADFGFSGGATTSTASAIGTSPVAGAAAPAPVYKTARLGTFSYAFTNLIPDSGYVVRLHFAEITGTLPSDRTFNVRLNGTLVLTNLDVAAEVGPNTTLAKRFDAAADGAGKITVAFEGVTGQPLCSGIQVLSPASVSNQTPILPTIANKAVVAGQRLAFTPRAFDPDLPAQTLAFSLTSVAARPVIDSATGSFSWTPSRANVGTHAMTIRVSDGNGSAAQTFDVTVLPPPQFVKIEAASSGTLTARASVLSGKLYKIESTLDPAQPDWTEIGEFTATSTEAEVALGTIDGMQSFFRLRQAD